MGDIYFTKIIGIFIILILNCACDDEVCNRRPLGTKADALRPDNQFVLEVDKIKDNKYIPGTTYTVILRSTYGNTTFIAFTISLKEDTLPNKANPRKPTHLQAGRLEPFGGSTVAKFSPACDNTIIQSDVTAKTKVEVKWHAPGKDNRCVSIFSVVAIKPDVWYSYEPPLSMKVCEDPRKSEDMPPPELDGDCGTCEDARYRLTFEGLWSYNTHQNMFPSAKELARFSDIVGASHSPSASLFSFASEATKGIKMLAEQGNTTKFEVEIQSKLPTTVRTVIKATSPERTDKSTVTSFRASPQHHRLSIAVGILPSPDWFLGVSQLELCDDKTKAWRGDITLNLYPIDAGTDKGLDFESSNEEQSPFQPITLLSGIGKDQMKPEKPFARLVVKRIRTYTTPQCLAEAAPPTEGTGEVAGEGEGASGGEATTVRNEPKEVRPSYATTRPRPRPRTTTSTTTTSEEPPVMIDPESSTTCPMTSWEDWQPCVGQCVNGTVDSGIQTRLRYHVVDGVVIQQVEQGSPSPVPQECLDTDVYPDMDFQPCQDSCSEDEEEEGEAQEENEAAASSRRTWRNFRGKK